ncbi:TldD/PmbA family protein [candidate division TA06 bacterium]|uniref:TldD/PmbA family protein n=1 Tax=candidate division TA06 bacterium TaxID=2250710 RepID=A0A933MJV4_UNCT6|nr:TldD/PmbA family protein [candidate division TA06 bacterium]
MKDLAQHALNVAELAGASYADIRIINDESERVEVKDGQVGSINRGTSGGFGIRVIANGAWGFASSSKIDKAEIERVAKLAVKVAKASALLKVKDLELAPVEKYIDKYVTPHKKNPLEVPLEEKIALLLKTDAAMRQVKGVNITESRIAAWVEDQLFASTIGSLIEQRIIQCGGGYTATAVKDGDVQYRSYPCSHGGQWESNGYEMIEQLDFAGHAGQTAGEAVALLSAVQCPSGEKEIIIEGSQLSLQIHESVGHPLELDRVFGSEANFAGTSFATTDNLDKLKYGSDIVTIISDPICPRGLGSYGYDDEGVKAQKSDLIKNGMLVNYLSSRETAKVIGKKSTGAMRADGWGNMPIVRMTCINLEPGTKSLEQIVSETEDGIYLATNKSFSIDDRRSNFQFGTEIAWEIKKGKLGQMLKNATYTGFTPQFWNACDAIAGPKDWKIWGTCNCGKGEPQQLARTAQGCAPSRFRDIKVGVIPGKK